MRNAQRGFTLIEVIVAMLILVTGIAAALKLFPAGLEAQQRAFGMSQGVFFAEHATEQMQRDGQNSFDNFPGVPRPMPAAAPERVPAGTAVADKQHAYVGSYPGGAVTWEPWSPGTFDTAPAAYIPGNLKVVYVSVPLVDRVIFRGTVARCADTSVTGSRVSPGYIMVPRDEVQRLENVAHLLDGKLVLMLTGKAQGRVFVIQGRAASTLRLRAKDNPRSSGVREGDAFVIVDRSDFQTLMSDVGLTQMLYD